ncbi:MAG TPA: hypothetical protein VKP04_06840, partial [Ktedonobacteraceae bacterium]|nr:hypothetical protein [Ktedonobacteraceae bacterium]
MLSFQRKRTYACLYRTSNKQVELFTSVEARLILSHFEHQQVGQPIKMRLIDPSSSPEEELNMPNIQIIP